MRTNLLTIFLMLTTLYSCKPKREVKSIVIDNKLLLEYEYYISDEGDTIADGFYRSYYPNGKPKEEYHYVNDIQDGIANFYWNNGNRETQLVYQNDKLITQLASWDYNGKRTDSFTVVNGHGVLKTYHENGALQSLITMKDSIENGAYFEYDTKGKLISTKKMLDGKEEGEAMKVLRNGNIVKYNYRYGLENGDYFIYNSSHILLEKGKLRDNILIDTGYVYHPNQTIKMQIIYKSNNYTAYDSISLGLTKPGGILGIFQDNIRSKGVIVQVKEFDKNGVLVMEQVVEEGP